MISGLITGLCIYSILGPLTEYNEEIKIRVKVSKKYERVESMHPWRFDIEVPGDPKFNPDKKYTHTQFAVTKESYDRLDVGDYAYFTLPRGWGYPWYWDVWNPLSHMFGIVGTIITLISGIGTCCTLRDRYL